MAMALPAPAASAPQFGSSGPISTPSRGAASPYPSTIEVSGLVGVVLDVNVIVEGLTHPRPRDLDLLLQGPTGAHSLILSDVGGDEPVSGVTFTLDDDTHNKQTVFPPLQSGRFKPANPRTLDVLPAPAPKPLDGASLKRFDRVNPNGRWSLFVYDDDDEAAAPGTITGWRLEITVATFRVKSVKVREGQVQTFTVTLTPGTPATIGMTYRTLKSTAKGRKDFKRAKGFLSFGPGSSSATVSVKTRDDRRDERAERYFLVVTDSTGLSARGRGRIRDND